MFSNKVMWVVWIINTILVLCLVGIYYYAPRTEKYLQQEEEKQRENFSKLPLIVCINDDEDGSRKSGFESIIIGAIIKEGVSVILAPNERHLITKDNVVIRDGVMLVGTFWHGEYSKNYFDYRLISISDGNVSVLASGCEDWQSGGRVSYLNERLANSVVKKIVSMLPLPKTM